MYDSRLSMELRQNVADLLGVPIDALVDDQNLIELGLDSIRLMRLAGQCRRRGFNFGFAEMVSMPTLAAWSKLIEPVSHGAETVRTMMSPVAAPDASFELAPMQRAYWVGRSEGQQLGGVTAHFYNEFDGQDIDPMRLEAAVRRVIERHGMLRMQVLPDGRQRILAESPWPGLRVHDLRELTSSAAQESLDGLRKRLSRRCMDVSVGEVFDVQLSLLPDALKAAGIRLHVSLDMIAADALSLRVLLADLASFYASPGVVLPPIGIDFAGYLALRSRERRTAAAVARLRDDRAHWEERLPQLPNPPRLPSSANEDATTVVRRHRYLSPAQRQRFEAHARQHGLTPAMALAAVFCEVLTCWSDEPSFLLNLPLFDRAPLHPDASEMVGDFTSSILLAWDGAAAGSFAERARRLQSRFHADVAHAGFSGLEVLRELSRLRGEQVIAPFVYTSALGLGELFPDVVKEQFGQASWIISQGPQVRLDAQVTEFDGGLLVNVDAREAAFAPGVLDALFESHGRLVERLLNDASAWLEPVVPQLPVGMLEVRRQANETARPLSGHRLHDGFFAKASVDPSAPALLWSADGVLSYGELAQRALGLAAHLVDVGVRPGDLVALHLPKGPEQAVGALGVLAAGAAYLPIGIDQPPLRLQRIVEAAGAAMVLDSLPTHASPLQAPVPGSDSELAYVLYTSGSTGMPKGVEITHSAAMNTVDDLNRRLELGVADRTLALSALEFDLSIYDLFGPLSVGGAVVCIEEHERKDAIAWAALMQRHRVTVLNCVPALLDMTLTVASEGQGDSLRAVLLGGDWVTVDLPGRLARWSPHCRFIALGGTTETAIHSTFCEVTEVDAAWTSIPYGKPLGNVQLRVVDDLQRDRPDFVAGELWIGGAGVARGYRGDPQRSADKFIERNGARWYRTGDRARYLPDGTVEFLGRADFQIKLRGHRIELGEVEAALLAFDRIAQAVVIRGPHGLIAVATSDSVLTNDGVGVETDAGTWIDLQSPPPAWIGLRPFLEARLPAAMLPQQLWLRGSLPLTGNGKVDRKALAQAAGEAQLSLAPRDSGPALDAVEGEVARLWSELLDVPEVGGDQNFFSLGGDSVHATRMVSRLVAAGFTNASLSSVFAFPRLADFAATLKKTTGAEPAKEWLEDIDNRHEPFPPSDVQRAYWLGRDERFVLGGVGCLFYREYDAENLDIERLEAALNTLIARHEMLRVVFDEEGRQRILPSVPRYAVAVTDAEPGAQTEQARDALRARSSHRVFDPTRWPLFAIEGVRSGSTTRLAVSLDNLALDALSILTFYTEFNTLYLHPDASLGPAGPSFRDWMLQSRPKPASLDAAWAHWKPRLAELPPGPQLPLARQPGEIGRPRFVRHEALLDAADWRDLSARAMSHGITPSAVLLCAFSEVMSRWSSRPDLTLNLTLFDRQDAHPHIHRVLGDFTLLTLVAYRPVEGEAWLSRLQRMQAELAQALDHRELSTPTLLREWARVQGEPTAVMPVVFTSALGVPGGTAAPASGPFSRQVWGVTQTPQVWLDHQVVEAGEGIALNWDVVENLFPPKIVETMFEAYLDALRWIARRDWTSCLPDVMPAAQLEVRQRVNATAGELPQRPLHHDFFSLARSAPKRIALRWSDGQHWSYAQLADRALRLANALVLRSVRAGDVVAIHLPKGPEQIAAVLGVLAAGAVYLPIGIDQPAARREAMLRQSEACAVVTRAATAAWSPMLHVIDPEWAFSHDVLPEPVPVDPQQTAYIIFTSGSTGTPKGVAIPHRAALNTILDINHRFGIGPQDRVLAVSALDFDLSVYDLFGSLSAGGSLILIEEDARRDARRWLTLARRHEVTVWNSVPTLLDMLLTVGSAEQTPATLRLALVSGDWIGLDLPDRLRAQRPDCQFFAMGGATEASIWSNGFEVNRVDPAWASIPYGWPLRHQRFRVVDAHGRDAPDGVAGELWIGGAGVASGYCGAPQLTAERFVETADGTRWYRTGDQGRYGPEGLLEFLGRTDHQVKLRGHRIELGEVEAALQAQPGVERAVAAVTPPDGVRRLLAAVTARRGAQLDIARLRERVAIRLPAYMVPEQLAVLEALPLSANGKLDRAAVARVIAASDVAPETNEAPADDWEQRVAVVWQELLRIPAIGRRQSFFALGGDSLAATRFVEIVRQRHGRLLPLRHLFASPVLMDVATALRSLQADAPDTEEGAL